jgi:hypothetical protein
MQRRKRDEKRRVEKRIKKIKRGNRWRIILASTQKSRKCMI